MIRIVHFESGLGNQMLDYCDYIAIKKMNPNDQCYAEDIIYAIPECNDVISQWNGLEIENIFGIQLNKLESIFSYSQWNEIINDVRESDFWHKNWNYSPYIVDALKKQGLIVHSEFTNYDHDIEKMNKDMLKRFLQLKVMQSIKRGYRRIVPQIEPLSSSFALKEYSTYEGHTLCYMFRGSGIEKIEREIRNAFQFPVLEGEKNKEISKKIKNSNSVSIHIRAGDAMVYNKKCLERKFIHKAIKLIEKRIDSPQYFIFGNPDGLRWFRENMQSMQLSAEKVTFVDWNSGLKSYIDMSLMSMCKHNIILFSSFAWWASFLNENSQKITISPEPKMLTTDWL